MTATLTVIAFHLLTWQRHFRRQGGSGRVSDRPRLCVSWYTRNGLVFGLIVVSEWDDTSGRVWRDLCFQHIANESNTMTLQMNCSEGSKLCICAFYFREQAHHFCLSSPLRRACMIVREAFAEASFLFTFQYGYEKTEVTYFCDWHIFPWMVIINFPKDYISGIWTNN